MNFYVTINQIAMLLLLMYITSGACSVAFLILIKAVSCILPAVVHISKIVYIILNLVLLLVKLVKLSYSAFQLIR